MFALVASGATVFATITALSVLLQVGALSYGSSARAAGILGSGVFIFVMTADPIDQIVIRAGLVASLWSHVEQHVGGVDHLVTARANSKPNPNKRRLQVAGQQVGATERNSRSACLSGRLSL
jgi:hypothetical protein